MVTVGVHVPECPGRIGTDLGPKTLNIATTVRVIGWAANGHLGVSDDGATVQSGRAAGTGVVAAFVETGLA
jgi:hypothetical protein